MRADIFAYMIYSEWPDCPEYVVHIFDTKYVGTPKYGSMLGSSLPVGAAQQTTENYLNIWTVQNEGICYANVLH